MDDGERFRRALEEEGLRPGPVPVPVPGIQTQTIAVGTAKACDCGCGRPASVAILSSGEFLVTSREAYENLIGLLEKAAVVVWGPRP